MERVLNQRYHVTHTTRGTFDATYLGMHSDMLKLRLESDGWINVPGTVKRVGEIVYLFPDNTTLEV